MCPPPMNTMLEKQSKEEAIEKRNRRKRIIVRDVPPTIVRPTTTGLWYVLGITCNVE